MRKVLVLFIAFIAFTSHSQEKITQAILKQCAESKNPEMCTEQKLKDIFIGLIKPGVIDDLPLTEFLSVSAMFITDAEGKVIQDKTEIKCQSDKLKASIKAYINRLPAFYPKDESFKERRSVHIINFTLIEEESGQYSVANQSDLKQHSINPDYFMYDTAPLWKGCETTSNKDKDLICTSGKLNQYIQKNLATTKKSSQHAQKLYAYITINPEGDIILNHFSIGAEELQNQIRIILKNAPKLKPATINGIEVPAEFALPISLSITQ